MKATLHIICRRYDAAALPTTNFTLVDGKKDERKNADLADILEHNIYPSIQVNNHPIHNQLQCQLPL